jgi:hypothetical protein
MYGLEPACRRNPRLAGDALAILNKAFMGRCALFVGEVDQDQELSSCGVIVLEMTIKKGV